MSYLGKWSDFVRNGGRIHAYGTSEGVKKSWLKRHRKMLHSTQLSVWFTRNHPKHAGQLLNGIPLKSASPGFWVGKKDIPEPPLPALNSFLRPDGRLMPLKQSSGVIIMEKDNRIWLVKPANNFGGYEATFPKGQVEDGLTLQQNAMKEAFEESGLQVEITGYLGDFEGTTSSTRYYMARRVGGAPWAAHWESEKVMLAPIASARRLLNMPRDLKVLDIVR